MDSLPDKDTNQNYQSEEKTPIVCIQNADKLVVQLEGSHLTATTTETFPTAEKKNVTFQDEKHKEGKRHEADDMKQQIEQKPKSSFSDMTLLETFCSGPIKADFCKYWNNNQLEIKSSNPNFELNTLKEKFKRQQDIELKHFQLGSSSAEADKKANKFCSIATFSTSCEFNTVACQTQPTDQTSLNELSLLEISSLTSRSEQAANSLNNYAQGANACVSDSGSQLQIIKQPLVTSSVRPQEPPRTPNFSIITIEGESVPSLTDFRRPSLCHRIWDVFCDFCAATFLCLQVNRDCIFCLGFFAAFVVSASFLTAFFYHTLVASPALWQTPENSYF